MTEFQSLILQAVNAALLGKKIIVRRNGNNFYIAFTSAEKKEHVSTEAQQKQKNKFSAAASYAREALKDPELEKIYRAKATLGRSAFICAFTDFLKPPSVKTIDIGKYTGMPCSIIAIKAMDDFQVKNVEVSIYDDEGNLVEKDNAILDPVFRVRWNYTATVNIAKLQGCRIRAVAMDLAGNTGEKEITL
jgi:hypothetical protein